MSHSNRPSVWIDVLRERALRNPERLAYTFLPDGEQPQCRITYGQLDTRARAIAAKLQFQGFTGERALLLYPTGLEYIAAFLGCIYAGVAAVPAYPPQSARMRGTLPRLRAIINDAQPALALCAASLNTSTGEGISQHPELAGMRWLVTEEIPDGFAENWSLPAVDQDTLAFLQYTSGSTSTPKGVMVNHGNLLHNEELIRNAYAHTEESVVVGWLPLYHDMGLIGNVLQPLYCGGHCVLMPPIAFLQNPLRWLSAISRYRATTSGGPNFAFDLCVRKISAESLPALDLSSWKVAFNGAEPIRLETLEQFTRHFGPCGFRPETFYPCYGLAESTLIVSGGSHSAIPVVGCFESAALEQNSVVETLPGTPGIRRLVGCGQNLPGQKTVIVNPDSFLECPSGRVGEIWLSSPSVAQGYWKNPDETNRLFRAFLADGSGPYLRTGDLGFFHHGELFITGRLKDLIIVRGRNHYPQDIELTVEQSHPALKRGCGAAFSIESNGEERLVVVQEVERQHRHSNLQEVIEAIRAAIAEQHEIQVYAVALIKPGNIPKTSSGKIQRHACKARFLEKTLEVIQNTCWDDVLIVPKQETITRDTILTASPANRESLLRDYLLQEAANVLKILPSQLDWQKSLTSFGLDSLMAVELTSRIETQLGVAVPMAKLFELPNLAQLALFILANFAQESRPFLQGENQGAPASQSSQDSSHRANTIKLNERADLPLSFEQENLWLLHQGKQASSLAYNILAAVRLKGSLDLELLERNINEIIRRHEILRTAYDLGGQRPVQMVASSLTLRVPLEDFKELPLEKREAEARHRAALEAQRPFDLKQGPLFRPRLYRLQGDEHILILVVHHIACDGFSLRIFLKELALLYEEGAENRPASAAMPVQYADLVQVRRKALDSELWRSQLNYWEQKLGGPLPQMLLPRVCPSTARRSFQSAQELLTFSPATTAALKRFCQTEQCTVFMVLLAAFKALLHRCSGQKDLLIGSSVANRSRSEWQNVIGPFTNAVALRTKFEGDLVFREFLQQVRQTAIEAYAHQDVPFDQVLRKLAFNQSANSQAFQVVFLHQNFLVPTWNMHGIRAELEDFDTGMSNFELALVTYEKGGAISGSLKYSTDLFEPATIRDLIGAYRAIVEQVLAEPEQKLSQLALGSDLERKTEMARVRDQEWKIAVAATFTAELIQEPLSFWMEELVVPASIEFAPYNQVFQQLLDPQSLLSKNQHGLNVVLIRFADWQPETKATDKTSICEEALQKNICDFFLALKTAAARSTTAFLVCICPSDSEGSHRTVEQAFFSKMENLMEEELEKINGVFLLKSAGLLKAYSISDIYNPWTNELGHIPYSSSFFTVLGTIVTRKIHALRSAPYKVIVLDCDQTLWEGVCAEDGPSGIKIGPAQKSLQEFMIAQQEAGMLLCLCSKNDERDVLEVFERRADMPLKLKHFIGRRVNWESKSTNLRSLAGELGLGLSSFIFIDDNPVECAEVEANCPEVLTLLLPQDTESIPDFLRNVWAFDRLKVTDEDKERSLLYQQNFERERFRNQSLSFADFLAELELKVEIREMIPSEVERVSQLTQRTNQFNIGSPRRASAEIEKLRGSHRCLVTEAKDRFGNYGLVGVIIFSETAESCNIETFLLSCRALGKGIEHRMLAHLAEIAMQQNRKRLIIPCIRTEKNLPALNFFEEIGKQFRTTSGNQIYFDIPSEVARSLKLSPSEHSDPEPKTALTIPSSAPQQKTRSGAVVRIAREWKDIRAIEKAVHQWQSKRSLSHQEIFVPPGTPTETMLAEIWTEVLRLDRVGINDNFFALGGHSLLATVMISRIRNVFELELPLQTILEHPTIADLAGIIEKELISELSPEEMAATLEEFKGMSEEEIKSLLKNPPPSAQLAKE